MPDCCKWERESLFFYFSCQPLAHFIHLWELFSVEVREGEVSVFLFREQQTPKLKDKYGRFVYFAFLRG